MRKALFIALVMPLLLCCAGPKQLSYLQNLPSGDETVCAQAEPYRLQAGDQLTIRVSSFDGSAVAPFNVQNGDLNDIPYIVDKQGNILFPGLNEVAVAGKTVSELSGQMQRELSRLAKGAVVRVQLVSGIVTVSGEVNHPARLHWDEPGMNLIEALTAAGDLRSNASREVLVLRRTGNEMRTYRVDLRDKACLTSPVWQLQPGDIVYVQPRRGRLIYGR